MPVNHAVENALGTIGAVCWMIQIVPQIVKSYRERSTHGLSAGLMGIWACSCLPFSPYNITQNLSIPLQIQPHVFGLLCTVSWCQCLYYGSKWRLRNVVLFFIAFIVFWAGFETGSIYALRAGIRNGTDAPSQLYGYLTAVLLAVALLPQYWEIYKLKEVVGVSLLFMAVDIAGGVFSLLSLFFREDLDIAALVSYSLVVILDGIVVILSFILNPIAKRRRAREAGDDEVAVNGVEEEEAAIHSTAPNHHFAKPFDTRSTYESDMTETEEEREEREAKALSPPHTGIGRTASKDRT